MSSSSNPSKPNEVGVAERRLTLRDPFAEIELAWRDWGRADATRTVICVHGLTRNAHDFDALAAALARAGARVLAVDVVGRGGSSWLRDPTQYAVPTYAAQLRQWLDHLGLDAIDWIGTSMGGLIGMALAAGDAPPMARLVLNDIGPFVPRDALAPVADYLALDQRFASVDDAERHLRFIHAPFGPLTDAQWAHLAHHSVVADGDGWRLHYDPAIRVPFAEGLTDDIVLWNVWDAIRCPTLVLHGAESLLLSVATCAEMKTRGPGAEVVSFAGIGHAPALMDQAQIEVVRRWLDL